MNTLIPAATAASSALTLPAAMPAEALCRSGAAARIAGIPVATLRVWERRYAAVGSARSESGQRLYAPHDIERLVLLKKLVGLGHAIGTIAALPLESLLALATSHGGHSSDTSHPQGQGARVALCVAGLALARRLQSSAGRQAMKWSGVELVASFDDVAQASTAASAGRFPPADVLLVQLSSLHADAVDRVLSLRHASPRVIVVYDFGTESVAQRLRNAGITVHHDPFSLADLAALLPQRDGARSLVPSPTPDVVSPAPPPRFDEEALVRFVEASSVIACECPQHLVRIVMQLSAFESYSAGCASRSPADAQLHAYLADMAGSARALFESALERVARAEGIELPTLPRRRGRGHRSDETQ